ncbi:TPA: HNH endonuclease [Staphylococcus aureus]|uniref:NUMOD4 domain-containing protein n=1 Tax=Staphylococcus aureus TaxID=1280 RepID=UPI000F426E5B|nr:NUMOD4 domain-containing protein [Staphylococcus aureus]RNH88337.1 hypothetical protein EE091_10225 [Staphylococcus aureus]HDG5400712.1 HNH endonuclease [Staphylococcus aureus]HDG5487699.1 HNH endonuclease [Staphylococcus aureus]HDG5498811.1 HNH endonuclease [Staphylococcus aureus]HDZ3288174.1 HNH endonuclease [Staphylococcus aureus]
MKEIWKDIPGYESYYQASNLGRIKRLKGKYVPKDRILKPQKRPNGYLCVTLSKNKRVTKSIHRLIMLSFVGYSDLEVNHIDGNKKNNQLNNLEYCSSRDNSRHVFNNRLKITNIERYGEHIIDDYKNGVNLTRLVKTYHVDFRDLKEFLTKNGFSLKECREGNYKKIINQERMQEVRKLLNDNPNITNKEINRITGLSNMTITRILKNIYQQNVERREQWEKYRG